MEESLLQYAKQADLDVLFLKEQVKGLTARKVKGKYTRVEALRRLISGRLCFEFHQDLTPVTVHLCAAIPNPPERLAGSDALSQPSRHDSNPHTAATDGSDIQSVLVTGTHIRRWEPPVGPSPISLTPEDFARYNITSLADLARVLPLIFRGGPSQDTHHIGAETLTNSGLGSAVNVRGLGARATLVLINGRRLAPSGTSAAFFDVIDIPFSAIKRVDILADGVSAIYGADAVAGVVNIITRDSHDANETTVHLGMVTQGAWKDGKVSQSLSNDWGTGGVFGTVFYSKTTALPERDRSFGSSELGNGRLNLDLPESWPPNIAVGKQTWAVSPGVAGIPSTAQLQPGSQNPDDVHSNASLLPEQELVSAYGEARQSLGDHVTLTVEGIVSHRRATDADGGERVDIVVPTTSPYYLSAIAKGAPMLVETDLINVLGPEMTRVDVQTVYTDATLNVSLGSGHNLTLSSSRSLETEHQRTTAVANLAALTDPSVAFDPFAAGASMSATTLAAVRGETSFDLGSELHEYSLQWSGPLGGHKADPIMGALGVEYRTQSLSTSDSAMSPGAYERYDRRLKAAFAELTLPVLVPESAVPGVESLEFSIAGRYEDYSDFGHSTVPRFGFRWTWIPGLELRGSLGESIRTPNLPDLNTLRNTITSGPAPAAAGDLIYLTGNNAGLKEERARTGVLELDFARALSDHTTLSLEVDFFDTHYFDRIQAADLSAIGANLLTSPNYSSLLYRNPSPAVIDRLCNSPQYFGNVKQCLAGNYLAVVDLRLRNIDSLFTRGIDFKGAWSAQPAWGGIELGWSGTYILEFADRAMPTAPVESLRNTQNNPIDLQAHAYVDVTWRGFGSRVTANFSNRYRDTVSQPNRPIASWTTLDLQLRYVFDAAPHDWRHGLFISFDVQNLQDHNPPFLINRVERQGYDEENADPLGRVASLQVRKQW